MALPLGRACSAASSLACASPSQLSPPPSQLPQLSSPPRSRPGIPPHLSTPVVCGFAIVILSPSIIPWTNDGQNNVWWRNGPAWSYGPLCWRSAAQLRFLVAASSPPSKRGMPRTQIEDAQLTRAVTPKCAPTRLVRTERLSEKTRSWDCRCMTDDAYNRTWGFDECPREST